MIRVFLVATAMSLATATAQAGSADVRDRVLSELREDGYQEIRINRTLLGRLRFIATRKDAEREIVVHPVTGVILRDYVRFFILPDDDDALNSGLEMEEDEDEDEDEEDEDEEDEDEEEEDEEEDNSGSGSSNSGSGSDSDNSGSDDSDSDNSGSGSDNSGSGGGSDDSDPDDP